MKSIFDDLKVREPKQAFENAIKKNMKHPENWMYMHSTRFRDYFKNHDTGAYISYFNFTRSKLMTVKEYREGIKNDSKEIITSKNNDIKEIKTFREENKELKKEPEFIKLHNKELNRQNNKLINELANDDDWELER